MLFQIKEESCFSRVILSWKASEGRRVVWLVVSLDIWHCCSGVVFRILIHIPSGFFKADDILQSSGLFQMVSSWTLGVLSS